VELFSTPSSSPILIGLTAAYGITSSITTFDKRVIQAIRAGAYPPDDPLPPKWVGLVLYVHWAIGVALVLLNWKFALIVFLAKFVLSVLPVLETVGNILMGVVIPIGKRRTLRHLEPDDD
jgi:hypothetical protein